MIMKMKYIKPVILCCYDIDMSIMTATGEASTDKTGDSLAKPDTPDFARPGEEATSTKGTSWNLWEDEEENSFY